MYRNIILICCLSGCSYIFDPIKQCDKDATLILTTHEYFISEKNLTLGTIIQISPSQRCYQVCKNNKLYAIIHFYKMKDGWKLAAIQPNDQGDKTIDDVWDDIIKSTKKVN